LGGGGLAVAYSDGFGETAAAVEDVRHLVGTDLPLGMDELLEPFAVEGDALFGEGELVVTAEEGGEHAGRLILGVGFEVVQRSAIQLLDPCGDLGGRWVGQSAGAYTVGGPGPPRHAGVPERRWQGAGWS
jgi:hypothetical protein